jgi:hypothetical protein
MRFVTLGVLLFVLALATPVSAERELLAPRTDAPAEVAPGGILSLQVDVATGLTPPPGIQEDRALRMFALSLCAEGVDLGGGTRRCFPLAVRNVRPLDGTSLRYRVDAPVPIWVAPWIYDLTLRFPGGQVAAPRALIVREAHGAAFALAPIVEVSGQKVALRVPAGAGVARVHVGAAGLSLARGRFHAFPLPDSARGFAPGFVALVEPDGSEPALMTKRQGPGAPALVFRPARAQAGLPVVLRAAGVPPGARLFWWLDAARGAQGNDVTTVFLLRGQAPLQLLAVAPDGRVARAEALLPIWQRRAFGCALGAPAIDGRGSRSLANCFMLLAIGAWLRRSSHGGARFAIRRPRRGLRG